MTRATGARAGNGTIAPAIRAFDMRVPTLTVKALIEILVWYPHDALVMAYEGEQTGLQIHHADVGDDGFAFIETPHVETDPDQGAL